MNFQIERLLLFSILIVVAAISLKSCLQVRRENDILKRNIEVKIDSTVYWKDKYGTEHASRRLAEGNLETIKISYQRLMDSVKARLNIKKNNIQTITTVGSVVGASIIPSVDTIYTQDTSYNFSFRDSWLQLSGTIGKESKISYNFKDSLVITTYSKRKSLFGPYVTYMDAYSLNPNVRISGINGLRITATKDSRFGLGAYLGYGWNGQHWSPSVGLSIHYSLIKL